MGPLPGTSRLCPALLTPVCRISSAHVSACSIFNFLFSITLRRVFLFSSSANGSRVHFRYVGSLPDRTPTLKTVTQRQSNRASRGKGSTGIAVRNARARDRAYRLSGGRGLCLLVQPNGSKWWQFRYHWDGNEGCCPWAPTRTLVLRRPPNAGTKCDARSRPVRIPGRASFGGRFAGPNL